MAASIDIIVAARDVGPYIRDSLSSCVGAKDSANKISITVVNDGSSDNTNSEISAFAERHSELPIRIIQTNGVGAGVARNIALDYAASDFVVFVDGDDLIDRSVLDLTISEMISSNAQIGCPAVLAFDDNLKFKFLHDNPEFREKCLGGRPLVVTNCHDEPRLLDSETSMCMRVFNRSFIKENGISFSKTAFCEDVEPSRRAILAANRIILSKDPYYYYRMNRVGQATSRVSENVLDVVNVVRLTLDSCLPLVDGDLAGAWLSKRLVKIACWACTLLSTQNVAPFSSQISHEFDRIPLSWWKILCRLPDCNPRIMWVASVYAMKRNQKNKAESFFSHRAPRFNLFRKYVEVKPQ
jgi:glycosyltransferase involved in cell wall biosynthesis